MCNTPHSRTAWEWWLCTFFLYLLADCQTLWRKQDEVGTVTQGDMSSNPQSRMDSWPLVFGFTSLKMHMFPINQNFAWHYKGPQIPRSLSVNDLVVQGPVVEQ